MGGKRKTKPNHSKFKAFLNVVRKQTIAFTASYCTLTHSQSHSLLPRVVMCRQTQHDGRARPHTYTSATSSAQYVQVDGRGLGEALEHAVDLFDVQPHVGLPLPAAQHQVIHLFRTGTRPLQHTALGDALNHLQDTRWQCDDKFPSVTKGWNGA